MPACLSLSLRARVGDQDISQVQVARIGVGLTGREGQHIRRRIDPQVLQVERLQVAITAQDDAQLCLWRSAGLPQGLQRRPAQQCLDFAHRFNRDVFVGLD